MLKNYVKIALRNILRQKGYAFINIFGLAVGMTATILILLFVQHELSYDKYHENADRTYRISRAWLNDDGEISLHLGHCAPPFGPLILDEFEGIVEKQVRVTDNGGLVTFGDVKFEEQNFYFADEDLFKVFSWKFIAGDPETALSQPGNLVITESIARKYFGAENPIGKVVNYEGMMDMKVTGVVEDIPQNSHFQFDLMSTMHPVIQFYGGPEAFMSNFGGNNFSTYVLLKEGYDYKDFEAQLPDFIDRHFGVRANGDLASKTNVLTVWPLTDIHLKSHLDSEIGENGDMAYIYIFTIIAALTLIIACINFVNLATARSAKRAKEVGLRKVMGAARMALVRQFLTESEMFALFSVVVAVVVVILILPWFNNFTGKELSLNLVENSFMFLMLVAIMLLVGVIAGSYPALYMSGFQPSEILKGGGKKAGQKFTLRSILVVVQFGISICLIIGLGIVLHQLDFVKSKSLGFNEERVLVLPIEDEMLENYEALRSRFLLQPGIEAVSLTSRIPSGRLLDSNNAQVEVGGEMTSVQFRIADVHVDHDFLNALEVPFASGRNFNPNLASDSLEAFVINEATVSAIGWSSNEEAVGKKFNYGNRSGYIIGVVEDFHFESLKQKIAPIVFLITSGRNRNIVFKLDIEKQVESLAYLKDQWSYLRPGYPFEYRYIDEEFDSQYAEDDKLAELGTYFSILAIIIAGLGLFGLASFTAEQRFKEIGIRKVLGASVLQILILLSSGFTVLVIISFFIAAPVAYFLMQKWLSSFAYADAIQIWPFVSAFIFAVGVAWLTVGVQTMKAATTNPVDSLHNE